MLIKAQAPGSPAASLSRACAQTPAALLTWHAVVANLAHRRPRSLPRHLQPTIKEIVGAEREAEYFAALDEMAENAFDDQVCSCCRSWVVVSGGRCFCLDLRPWV